jgi:hypothetical protein
MVQALIHKQVRRQDSQLGHVIPPLRPEEDANRALLPFSHLSEPLAVRLAVKNALRGQVAAEQHMEELSHRSVFTK